MRNRITWEQVSRFWSKVNRGGSEECWEWTGVITHGYGEISIDHAKYKAHRLSWMLHNGELKADDIVMHECDNPSCVNPLHLTGGTPAQNSAAMVARGRSKKGALHHNTSLTDEDIRNIRKDDRTQSYLAKVYGVSQSSISHIKTRTSWSHVK